MRVTNDYLQFSAPASPGSSGSPVFDMRGEVVGITTRVAAEGQGMSFAIPAKVIRRVLDSMERNEGRVRRAYLGIGFLPLDRRSTRNSSVSGGQGVLINEVVSRRSQRKRPRNGNGS